MTLSQGHLYCCIFLFTLKWKYCFVWCLLKKKSSVIVIKKWLEVGDRLPICAFEFSEDFTTCILFTTKRKFNVH